MLARFRVILPFTFFVYQKQQLAPYEFDWEDYHIRIHPPMTAVLRYADAADAMSPIPVFDVIENIKPTDTQDPNDMVTINGTPTLQANLLQIDFCKDQFRRFRHSPEHPTGDVEPDIELIFKIANGALTRIRTVSQVCHIRTIARDTTLWRLDFVADNGTPLPEDPLLFRLLASATFTYKLSRITPRIWQRAFELPIDYVPFAWDVLLLDSARQLPDVGPALVLAYSALETLIYECLDRLASRSTLPLELWKWINDRRDFRKEPSVSERFNTLLRVLTGHSLTDENILWESFCNLKTARDSFVHEGEATIGTRVVTGAEAQSLVTRAKEIADWVEELLPAELRRPRVVETIEWRTTRAFAEATQLDNP